MRVVLVSFMPFIDNTMSMTANKTRSDANAKPTVSKNVFKTRLSFDLKAMMIEKSIIEINIKNSTITKTTKRTNDRTSEILSATIVESKSVKMLVRFGPAYIIKIEITKVAKPADISIIAVKYFELMS